MGKYAIDLVRFPDSVQNGDQVKLFCGVENDCYILISFEHEITQLLQKEKTEN